MTPAVQSSITSFTRVAKPNTAVPGKINDSSASKRHHATILDSEDEDEQPLHISAVPFKRVKLDPTSHPKTKYAHPRSNTQGLLTPRTTPQKVQKFKDCLIPQYERSKPEATRCPSPVVEADEDYQQEEQEAEGNSREIPAELHDIIALQSSFIKALALHYAHHGTAIPIRLNTFLPCISKIWGKRALTVLDIQRCLGSMASTVTAFHFNLYDYGREQTCLEMADNPSLSSTFALNTLTTPFAEAVKQAWETFQGPFPQDTQANEEEIQHFISTLPLASITPSPSLKKIAPLFEKGQRRLDSLRKPNHSSGKENVTTVTRSAKAQPLLVRSNSLLDRLKAKQAATASGPALPTKEAMERVAALQRLPEVAATLCMLRASSSAPNASSSTDLSSSTTGSRRQTFSFTNLVQRIQDSSRSCMSRDEVRKCIILLAVEVTKGMGFVEVIGTSKEGQGEGLVAVVVDAGRCPGDIAERCRRLLDLQIR